MRLSWPADGSVHVSPDQSWIVLAGTSGLHSYPLDAHQGPARLDLGAADFASVVFTPDSSRVLFSTSGTSGNGLFSALIDGSQAAVPILLSAGAVDQVEVTSDGSAVLFLADSDLAFGKELYNAPVDGSDEPTELAGPWVFFFQEDPSSGRVVYYDHIADSLYSVPTQGGFPATLGNVRLSNLEDRPVLVSRGRVIYQGWQIVCGGYDEVTRLYSVPIAGGQAAKRLDFGACSEGVNPRVELVPFGDRVLFAFRRSLSTSFEVFRAPVDASSAAHRIDGPDHVQDLRLSRDGGVLLCTSTQDTYGHYRELFAKRMRPWTRTAR